MTNLRRSVALLAALVTLPALADTPPLLLPDPARLAEAEQLAKILPIEAAIGKFLEVDQISIQIAEAADQWLLASYPKDHDSSVRQVFSESIKGQVDSLLDGSFDDARREMAEDYARHLSVEDLVATRKFASTSEGQAYLSVQLRSDYWLKQSIVRSIYARLDLDKTLQDARETSQLIDRVNRKP
jgi:hypothetical protein